MTCEEILQTVRGFCAREGLLEGRRQIALAVSGGADSMALLCLMRPLAEENGITLTVCHVNHGLRGETADRDEAFVREACARLGLPLRVFHAAELEAEVGRPQAGEDWARRLRYACFGRLLAEGIDAVATAHTGSDQAETLLFRLARGTGLHGAAGIRPSRPGYLRPLLCLTRADTEAVCRACGETWVTDETNEADDYARNRLRHGALPALCAANRAAERNLARFCEKAARADEYFARQAESLLASARVTDPKRLPGGARCALRTGQPVWRLTLSSSTRPSTASWSRCGTRRKSISGCWRLSWRGAAARCSSPTTSASVDGKGCSGGRKATTTSARRGKKQMFRSVQYPCPRAAITHCPGAERCRFGWFRPVLKKKHRSFIKKT